jgi:hypothetical protein
MEENEATALLLKAANQKQPWDAASLELANKITSTLGFHASAISIAGSAIRDGLCKLNEYLEFYERQWKSIGMKKQSKRTRDNDNSFRFYATFDLNLQALEQRGTEASEDALQLLNTFGFLHSSNIQFDILRRVVENARIEKEQAQLDRQRQEQLRARAPPTDWATWSRESLASIFALHKSPLVLPRVSIHHSARDISA